MLPERHSLSANQAAEPQEREVILISLYVRRVWLPDPLATAWWYLTSWSPIVVLRASSGRISTDNGPDFIVLSSYGNLLNIANTSINLWIMSERPK
jgi:hypothetical protein